MFHCYVLRSEKTGRRYVGSCENLSDRIHRHNAGESKATKHGVPWVLIHSESFATRSTRKDDLHIEICSACHPFFTGKQKLVDTAGRVDRFNKRYGKKAEPETTAATQ